MKTFIVYNCSGKILRTGICQDRDFVRQPNAKEFVMEGEADDVTQKVLDGKVVNKTLQELAVATFTPVIVQLPFEKQHAQITNKQWQDVLERIERLENSNE